MKQGRLARAGGTALAALSLTLCPAYAASLQHKPKPVRPASSLTLGGFTPAVADPRLAAALAARGFDAGSFRFTPSVVSSNGSKAVKVAVRARAGTTATAVAMRTASADVPTVETGLTPTAYNLGAGVGWHRFALSGDVAQVKGGLLPNGHEAAELGISYLATNRFVGRLQVGAERNDTGEARALAQENSYSLDLGGSYRLTHNIALTGGVRYKIQRDRLQLLADDERRDSQAVYIGTAFHF